MRPSVFWTAPHNGLGLANKTVEHAKNHMRSPHCRTEAERRPVRGGRFHVPGKEMIEATEELFRHGTALAASAYGNRASGTRRPTIWMPATVSSASDFTEVSGLPESTSVPICAAMDRHFVDRLASAFRSSPVAGIVSAYVFGSRLA